MVWRNGARLPGVGSSTAANALRSRALPYYGNSRQRLLIHQTLAPLHPPGALRANSTGCLRKGCVPTVLSGVAPCVGALISLP